MADVNFSIDGVPVAASDNRTVLQAALDNGIYIPHLCWHPDLSPFNACRLCLVKVDGRVVTSCDLPVREGMDVVSDDPDLCRLRRINLELILADHDGDCLLCSGNLHCKLQETARRVGVEEERLKRLRRPVFDKPVDTSNPFFVRDMNKCILCGICVRTCEELQGTAAIDFAGRGFDTVIAPFNDLPIAESTCESCGECVVRCPTGALAYRTFEEPDREVETVCTYCGCGCGVLLGAKGRRVVSARAVEGHPASGGMLCVKGRFGFDFVNSPERLRTPLVREGDGFREASWDEALELAASRLRGYGGEEFAAIASAKCTNEENYLIQKFARAVMGSNNVDHCARLCHSPTVAGLAAAFGSGAMTNSIAEIADASCIFAIGTNTTAAHPIVAVRVKEAVRKGAFLIVANPRRIPLADYADIFLQHRPGSDVALLMGMCRVILEEGLADRGFIEARCEGFGEFEKSLEEFDPDTVERITGVPRDKMKEAALAYASNPPASILFAMGITQHTHGTDNVKAVANLAMLTGNVGRPSGGVNPLRGQNNVQGACDMGALPNVFPGYQKVSDPAARRKFAEAWGGAALDPEPGLTHLEIFDAAFEGRIKALYLVGENPVLSEADASHVEEALRRVDFLVVQDIFLTETARFADVVLPAASLAEKDGTVTNTERRIQRVRKVVEPVGDARPDWRITCGLARRMGAEGFDFSGPAEVMAEIASLTPIYGGVSYERLEGGGLQWPCRNADDPGTPFLHAEKFASPDGKGRFFPLSFRPPAEEPDEEYPLVLTTERSLYHFHTSTMTRKVKGLMELHAAELVRMNPLDAERLGLADGDRVKVVSRRGKVEAVAVVSEEASPGVVCMSFHFAESPTNRLTNSARDPAAKTPETKVCAVRVEKA